MTDERLERAKAQLNESLKRASEEFVLPIVISNNFYRTDLPDFVMEALRGLHLRAKEITSDQRIYDVRTPNSNRPPSPVETYQVKWGDIIRLLEVSKKRVAIEWVKTNCDISRSVVFNNCDIEDLSD